MIIRRIKDAIKTDRKVTGEGWESIRLILKDDNMGFSFHITTIIAGAKLDLHYQNHLESVFCLSGEGSVIDHATNETHSIEPGTLYVLDQHDKHTLIANNEMIMACVFNPPLHGKEVHDASGAYPLEAEKISAP